MRPGGLIPLYSPLTELNLVGKVEIQFELK